MMFIHESACKWTDTRMNECYEEHNLPASCLITKGYDFLRPLITLRKIDGNKMVPLGHCLMVRKTKDVPI